MSWSARDEAGAKEFFDSPADVKKKVEKLANLFRERKHIVVFTGAGISTSAGIPDFRSGLSTVLKTGPGLWAAQADYERRTNGVRNDFTKNDPTRPKVDLDKMVSGRVNPTFSHLAVSKLLQKNFITTVWTQNVDNLHRKSGVPRKNLVELHGNLQCERCSSCGKNYERDFRVGPNPGRNHFTGRYCDDPKCRTDGYNSNGALKDYLVPFGEDLPASEVTRAWNESEVADFCLVMGSSMTVTPACDYAGWISRKRDGRYNPEVLYKNDPDFLRKTGGLAIINIQRTPYDADADVVIHGFCDDVMRLLMEELGIAVEEG